MRKIAFFLSILWFAPMLSGQKINDMAACYSFNKGDARDETGKNNAKAYGVSWVNDRFDNARSACYFQGTHDSYLNLGTGKELKPRQGSVSLWINIEQPIYRGQGSENNPIIFARVESVKDEFNDGYVMAYEYNLRKLCCGTFVSDLKGTQVFPSGTAYLRKWYHLVMTYDDKYLCLYIDGVLEGKSVKNYESKFADKDSVTVGIHYGPRNKRYFQGVIDDIYIYNRVLSPKEVLALYNAPNPNGFSVFVKYSFYITLAIALLFFIMWVIKWRIRKALKIEKEKNELKNNWLELENKVLVAQMNPHFIFNSLNTIQQFIIIHENDKAQLYLSRFSRMLRMILANNMRDAISLKEEIRIIEFYLEIESLRFNNVFTYKISLGSIDRPETIPIPRFLIQPFVENAIWHGLLPKEGEKLLNISLDVMNETTLSCCVEDNGVGRPSESKIADPERESFATNFIKQRLLLMSTIYKGKYELVIEDKVNAIGEKTGTRIVITIPILKN